MVQRGHGGGRLRRERGRAGRIERRARDRPAQGRRRRGHHPLQEESRDGAETGRRGLRLLVRVGLHALRTEALPLREQGGVREGVPRRLHRRGTRPDPGLVLHAHGPQHGAVRPAGVQEPHREWTGPGRGREEDVQAAQELPRPEPRHFQVRGRCIEDVPHQLAGRQSGEPQVPGERRPGRGERGLPPSLQRVPVLRPEHGTVGVQRRQKVRPLRRRGEGDRQPHRRVDLRRHPGTHQVRARGDGRLPPVHGHARAGKVRHPADQLVRPAEPRSTQGAGGRGGRVGDGTAGIVPRPAGRDGAHGAVHALHHRVLLPAPEEAAALLRRCGRRGRVVQPGHAGEKRFRTLPRPPNLRREPTERKCRRGHGGAAGDRRERAQRPREAEHLPPHAREVRHGDHAQPVRQRGRQHQRTAEGIHLVGAERVGPGHRAEGGGARVGDPGADAEFQHPGEEAREEDEGFQDARHLHVACGCRRLPRKRRAGIRGPRHQREGRAHLQTLLLEGGRSVGIHLHSRG
mmetsp:Transcript_39804/g.84840  ORF Transcript_39804/g.84840 Transcript_39804/m.84840 type:complete len:516 (-) Transcript_39804:570-2117(-)